VGVYVISAEGGKRQTVDRPNFRLPWRELVRDGKWIYFHIERRRENQIWEDAVWGAGSASPRRAAVGPVMNRTDGKFVTTRRDCKVAGFGRVPAEGGQE